MNDIRAVGEFRDITLDRVRELATEAFLEALRRYPDDVEGALIFFGTAIGLSIARPTEADITWATGVMERSMAMPPGIVKDE